MDNAIAIGLIKKDGALNRLTVAEDVLRNYTDHNLNPEAKHKPLDRYSDEAYQVAAEFYRDYQIQVNQTDPMLIKISVTDEERTQPITFQTLWRNSMYSHFASLPWATQQILGTAAPSTNAKR